MHREGHYGVSLLLYAPIAYHLFGTGRPAVAVLAGVVVLIGTPLPDYDLKTSLLKHRGFTHTVYFAAIFGGVVGGAAWGIGEYTPVWAARDGLVYGFGAGAMAILSHLAGDVITPAGLRPFAPLWDLKVGVGLVKAGNGYANYGLFLLGLVATGYVVTAGLLPGTV